MLKLQFDWYIIARKQTDAHENNIFLLHSNTGSVSPLVFFHQESITANTIKKYMNNEYADYLKLINASTNLLMAYFHLDKVAHVSKRNC